MINKIEKPDPNEWAHTENKKNYSLNGDCTAVFDEQVKNCTFRQPGYYGSICAYHQTATGRCLNVMADEPDTVTTDQVMKLFDPGIR